MVLCKFLLLCALLLLGHAQAKYKALTQTEYWSYDRCSPHGPHSTYWTRPHCSGVQNSPIDLCGARPFPEAAPAIAYDALWAVAREMDISHTGHTLRLTPRAPAPRTDVGNLHYLVGRGTNSSAQTWVLEQLNVHFGRAGHTREGSEHALFSTFYPLEIQLLHYNVRRGRSLWEALRSGAPDAVLGVAVLARLGDAEPPVLTELGRMAAEAEYYPHPLGADVALGALTNASSGAYLAYGGSLTAPACDEAVTWAVLTDAVAVTAATLDRLKAAPLRPDLALTLGTSGTFRPLQPRGGREVWSSAGDARACPAAGARDPAECERTDEEAGGAEEDDPTEVIVYIFMTLALGVLVQFVLDRLPPPLQFPYTVVIFLLGFALEAWSQGNGHVARAVQKIIHINAELILFVLVPPLLFMAGLDINPHVLRKQIWGALWLAGPGVVLSTCLTAASSYLAYGDWGWGWTTCFMFGALVSATDPVAVVALLHDLGAPESFAVLIDGEALLNDGSASVLFFVFKDFAQGEHKTWLQVMDQIMRLVFASCGVGLAFAFLLIFFISATDRRPHQEIGATIAATWLCFWVAEGSGLGGSGILATVTLSLTFTLKGTLKVSSTVLPELRHVWQHIAFCANTVLFFLCGTITFAKLREGHIASDPAEWASLFLLYGIVHAARGATILVSYPLLRRSTYGFDVRRAILLWWSGLRGAIGLALGLLVLDDTLFPVEVREQVMFQVAGLVTLTLLINAPTTEGLYAFLGMNASTEGQQLTAENLYAQLDSLIEARRAALKDLPIFRDVEVSPGCCPKEGIRRALYHQPSYFARKLQRCAWKAKKREATEDSVRREYWTKMLRSVALTYKRMFHKGSLSPELYEVLNDVVETALEQPGDLSDSIAFEMGLLRKAAVRDPNACIADVPVLRKAFLMRMFEKVVLLMRLPAFVHAHTEAALRIQNYAARAGAEYIAAEMWQSLRTVERDLERLYQDTLRYHKGLYPIGSQYMFSLFDLHFTEELLHHLGDGGLLDAKDLHHCIDTVAHKQRFLKDQMFWQLLKSDGQDEEVLVSPRSAYKFPPTFKEVERLIADADQAIFQNMPQRPPALHRSGSLTTSSAPHLALPLPPTPAMHPSTEAPSPSGITPLVLDTSDDMVQVQEDVTYALWAASYAHHPPSPFVQPPDPDWGSADCAASLPDPSSGATDGCSSPE